MAHSLSAKKRVRQGATRRARNRARKELVKDQLKSFGTALSGGDFTKAEAELRLVTRRLDKVAAQGTLHKNTASRKRSRMTKRLNAAKAGKGSQATSVRRNLMEFLLA